MDKFLEYADSKQEIFHSEANIEAFSDELIRTALR